MIARMGVHSAGSLILQDSSDNLDQTDQVADTIQSVALDISHSYTRLCDIKMTASVGGERLGSTPRCPGSKVPVPTTWASDLDIDLTYQLYYLLVDVLVDVPSGRAVTRDIPDMCSWLMYHAWDVAHSPHGDQVVAVLEEMQQRLTLMDQGDLGTVTARDAVAYLSRAGHHISADTLRQWVKRGHISAIKRGRTNHYDLEQIMAHVGI